MGAHINNLASLVEDIKKVLERESGDDGDGIRIVNVCEIESALSRYRPSTQADILGELKKLSKEIDGNYGVVPSCGEVDVAYRIKNSIDEIIRKFEGGVK